MRLSLREKIEHYSIPEPNTGCWLWLGAVMKNGYGIASVKSKNVLAHRLSYLQFRGVIADDMVIDHLCRVRCCVNPDHLEAVTTAENLRRGTRQRPQQFCRRGHPMTDNNVLFDSPKVRRCKTCARMRAKAFWRRKNA